MKYYCISDKNKPEFMHLIEVEPNAPLEKRVKDNSGGKIVSRGYEKGRANYVLDLGKDIRIGVVVSDDGQVEFYQGENTSLYVDKLKRKIARLFKRSPHPEELRIFMRSFNYLRI
jgi:hypothetical protein